MSWVYLVLAGLLEIVWAVGLKYSAGFSKLIPSLCTVAGLAGSLYLLSLALRDLPLATAYGVWVGIGTVGATVAGMLLWGEPAGFVRLMSLVLVIAGIAGLKATA